MHLDHPTALTRQRAKEAARFAHWSREATRSRGVSFSGLTIGEYEPATDAELEANARADVRRAAEFANSPQGRFQSAAKLIWHATGDERLLNCYSRGLDSADEPFAASLLVSMEGPAADQCRAALVEMAGVQAKRVAS